jgi:hypothetical protein
MKRTTKRVLIAPAVLLLASLTAAPAHADPPVPGTCTYSDGVVYGTGLPTDTLINFFITDASGRTGVVYGYTVDGTAQEPVPTPTVPTVYDYGSVTRGPSGDYKFWVYAECAAG